MKYPRMDWGTMEAVVNKLGGMDGVGRFLRGEISISEPSLSWREKDRVIYFSVTSDGTTGREWIERLVKKGFNVSGCAASILRSPDFKQTSGITTNIAVFKGELFSSEDRVTNYIRARAYSNGWRKPNAEVACLVREKLTDKEIAAVGLCCIVTMHEPINDSDGEPMLLSIEHHDDCGRRLYAFCGKPDRRWDSGDGFAFAASQA